MNEACSTAFIFAMDGQTGLLAVSVVSSIKANTSYNLKKF